MANTRNNEHENRARHVLEYRVASKVLVVKDIRNLPKPAQLTEGPYVVTAVYTNDTLTINRGRYEAMSKQCSMKTFFKGDKA